MMSGATTIVNRLGLHARAATRLVNCASGFQSEDDEKKAFDAVIELINNRFGEDE
jgi:phosphotransferase system HPr-like phosphotransfer protein